MRTLITIAGIIILNVAGCSKNDEPANPCGTVVATAPASEVATLRSYIQTNNITATEDARGFFYRIDNPGSGTKPTPCNRVNIAYVGSFTNGTVFDSNTNATFYLGQLILGWQEALPLIASGGSITLYVPPSLGYGANTYNGIPGNSILVFKIDLKAVL